MQRLVFSLSLFLQQFRVRNFVAGTFYPHLLWVKTFWWTPLHVVFISPMKFFRKIQLKVLNISTEYIEIAEPAVDKVTVWFYFGSPSGPGWISGPVCTVAWDCFEKCKWLMVCVGLSLCGLHHSVPLALSNNMTPDTLSNQKDHVTIRVRVSYVSGRRSLIQCCHIENRRWIAWEHPS